MYKLLQVLILFVLLAGGYVLYTRNEEFFFSEPKSVESGVITFNEKTPLRVRIADNDREVRQGLSDTESLGATEGMLFIFESDALHGIWMKEMLFPIDIIWVSKDGRIVDLRKAVTPDTYPQVFEPRTPARFVIETTAYFTDSFGIRVGDTVRIPDALLPEHLRNK